MAPDGPGTTIKVLIYKALFFLVWELRKALDGTLVALYAVGRGMCKMRRLGLALFIAMICGASLSADDGDRDKDKDRDGHASTNATEMGILGVAGASALGAGVYLAYRRRTRSHG